MARVIKPVGWLWSALAASALVLVGAVVLALDSSPSASAAGSFARCGMARDGAGAGKTLKGRTAADLIRGRAGNDAIRGHGGNDRIQGGGGSDCLRGGRGADIIAGGTGADRVRGGWGADTVNGGSGRDVLDGGRGRDRLVARDGSRDVVRCGRGNDLARTDAEDKVRGCEWTRRPPGGGTGREGTGGEATGGGGVAGGGGGTGSEGTGGGGGTAGGGGGTAGGGGGTAGGGGGAGGARAGGGGTAGGTAGGAGYPSLAHANWDGDFDSGCQLVGSSPGSWDANMTNTDHTGGSVAIERNVVGEGQCAARFTDFASPHEMTRSELQRSATGADPEFTYEVLVRVPSGQTFPKGTSLTQTKQEKSGGRGCYNGGMGIADGTASSGGQLTLTTVFGCTRPQKNGHRMFSLGALPRDRWFALKVHERFSNDPQVGFVQAWKDADGPGPGGYVEVVPKTHVDNETGRHVRLRIGSYRGPTNHKTTVFMDGVHLECEANC